MAYVTVGEENGVPIELHYTDHGAGPGGRARSTAGR